MGIKILIADDEAFLTQILKMNLQKRGFEVLVANNGQMAYEAAVRDQPDLVVSDFQMPVLDGLEFATRLKENPQTSHIPVLMLTARGHILTPQQIARTGIRALLAKPFSANQLIMKIEQTLPGQIPPLRQAV